MCCSCATSDAERWHSRTRSKNWLQTLKWLVHVYKLVRLLLKSKVDWNKIIPLIAILSIIITIIIICCSGSGVAIMILVNILSHQQNFKKNGIVLTHQRLHDKHNGLKLLHYRYVSLSNKLAFLLTQTNLWQLNPFRGKPGSPARLMVMSVVRVECGHSICLI